MRKKLRWLPGILCLVWLLGVACQPPSPPVTLNQEYQELGQVDATGATLCSTDGVCVSFPEKAVASSTIIKAKLSPTDPDIVGPVYDFAADTETFEKSIEITLPVPAGEEQSELAVAFFKDGAWQEVETRASADGKARIGITNHFSRWGLRRKCRPKPERCDGKDNDCDGQIDEGSQLCSKGQICKKGRCEPNCQCQSDADCANSEVCVNCSCQPVPGCPKGQTACQSPAGTTCVDLNTDASNCGACGQQCPAGETCQAGKCSNNGCTPSPEVCDGKDNDCDGQIDEGVTQACYTGPAGTQGVGVCKAGVQACQNGNWGPCTGQLLPSKEACDRKDNDCDGKVDEGCSGCAPGQTLCQNPGARVCVDVTSDPSHCGGCNKACAPGESCKGGVCSSGCTPSPEVCDGKDNDCDGQIDEGVTQACYTGPSGTQGVGICKAGVQACQSGNWGPCMGQVLPSREACDGKDNDCDGRVDEGCSGCAPGQTLCQNPGGSTCVDVTSDPSHCGGCNKACAPGESCKGGVCSSGCTPSPEVCDGKDNDCDGQIDEGVTQACYTGPSGTQGVGICKAGVQACQSGNWGPCMGHVLPSREICDNKDNDCDGRVDEGCGGCAPGQTLCQNPGASVCVDVSTDANHCGACGQACPAGEVCRAGKCSKPCTPSPEVCDGKDNDCDGQIDEGVTQACYTGPSGTQGVGICKAGVQACQNGNWGPCMGQVLPSPEACDSKDNDCDGRVDEACSCPPGQIACQSSGGKVCSDLNTDSNNCGTCGSACPAGQQCQAGACR